MKTNSTNKIERWRKIVAIPSLDIFEKSLQKRCRELILNSDPEYRNTLSKKVHECAKARLNPMESFQEYTKVIDKKYTKLAEFLGSLYEVKISWRRLATLAYLSEIEMLDEVEAVFPSGQWSKFCHDTLWISDCSYLDRLKIFLTKFKRIMGFNENSPDLLQVQASIQTINNLLKISKKGRDPLTHSQSPTIVSNNMRQVWEVNLLILCADERMVEIDKLLQLGYSTDRENILKQMSSWINSNHKLTNDIFVNLNLISLENLIIKGKT
jgi:hypothetical protein